MELVALCSQLAFTGVKQQAQGEVALLVGGFLGILGVLDFTNRVLNLVVRYTYLREEKVR